jgi:hypothetical protein
VSSIARHAVVRHALECIRGLRRQAGPRGHLTGGKHFMPGEAELERIGIRIVVYPQATTP